MKKIYLLVIALGFIGCKGTKTVINDSSLSPLDPSERVYIVSEETTIPVEAISVGTFEISDSGFTTDCSYNEQLAKAFGEARFVGANLISLTEVKNPDRRSSCFRLKGYFYRLDNQSTLDQYAKENESRNQSSLPSDADYALVNIYRPTSFIAPMIGYKIRLDDDTIIGRVRNGEKFTYKIKDFGPHKFWGKTEAQDSVIIDIQKGKEYYIRCGMKPGVVAGRPEIALIENHMGRSEFKSLPEK